MSGSALTPSHENGSSWLATRPRTAGMNAKAAKVAKGAAVAAQRIATLAVTRGGQLCDLRACQAEARRVVIERRLGLCVHRRGCDRSLTRPWGEQSVAFSEQDAEDLSRRSRAKADAEVQSCNQQDFSAFAKASAD